MEIQNKSQTFAVGAPKATKFHKVPAKVVLEPKVEEKPTTTDAYKLPTTLTYTPPKTEEDKTFKFKKHDRVRAVKFNHTGKEGVIKDLIYSSYLDYKVQIDGMSTTVSYSESELELVESFVPEPRAYHVGDIVKVITQSGEEKEGTITSVTHVKTNYPYHVHDYTGQSLGVFDDNELTLIKSQFKTGV